MRPLHGIADLADPRPLLTPARGTQPETRCPGPLAGRSVAVGPVGLGRRQAPPVHFGHRMIWRGRSDHHRLQGVPSLDAIVGIGPRDDHTQGHRPVVAGQVQRRAAFAPVDRRRARLFPPFFAGFLEPSRRI
jgi:hypothetical protein